MTQCAANMQHTASMSTSAFATAACAASFILIIRTLSLSLSVLLLLAVLLCGILISLVLRRMHKPEEQS